MEICSHTKTIVDSDNLATKLLTLQYVRESIPSGFGGVLFIYL